MSKVLGFVLGLMCVLSLATLSQAGTGWDFKVQGVNVTAERTGYGKSYNAEVSIYNRSTNDTYGGYGTVKVRLAVRNPDGGNLIFSDAETVEVENGSEDTVEFQFSEDVTYRYLDCYVKLYAPNGDEFDEMKESGVSVDWE